MLKQKKLADVKKDVVPFYLDKLDAIAKENNGHLALGRVRNEYSNIKWLCMVKLYWTQMILNIPFDFS